MNSRKFVREKGSLMKELVILYLQAKDFLEDSEKDARMRKCQKIESPWNVLKI